ncbi:MAG: flagellar hook-length control protein FliK [Sphingomonas sp.]
MFQLSLSTSLTPLATPGTGPVPVPTAAFTVALAGAAGAIEAPPAGALAAAEPRQAPAEAGKKLPIMADTGDALAWLEIGETQPSGRPIELGTPPAKLDLPSPAQALSSEPVEPTDPKAVESPPAPMPAATAIPPTVAAPAMIAKAITSDPAVPTTPVAPTAPAAPTAPTAPTAGDAIAGSAAASGETSITPVVADIRASAPILSKKPAADCADAKAPKHHHRSASRSEPDTVPIILAATVPSIAVVAVPPPVDRPAAAPASPKAASAPVIAAPVSMSRGPANATVHLPSRTDANMLSVTSHVDDTLAPAMPLTGEVAPGNAQAPAPLSEAIVTPDVAGTGVVAPPIPRSPPGPVSGAVAPSPITTSPIAASLRAAMPLAAHDAEPILPSPAPGPPPVASSAPAEATPVVEHRLAPFTATPTPVVGKMQAPASPSAATVIIRPEHTITPTVRETATSPAPVAPPAIASAPAIPATPRSPEHPSTPVSSPVLVAAPNDAAPVARPTLQTRQSAAIDATAASPVAANAPDPRATPVAAPPVTTTPPQSAGMMFGIALGAPLLDRRPLDRSSPRDEALQALTSLAATGSASPIAAAGGAQQGALDMHRDDWPQAMIDRIEALRDAADATSTRITLAPDALGKVDLSIRHDGDAVHVHFAAEAAQTRAILADAQPRLAELAQARGLKLGQATVDAGSGGQGQRQQAAATPAQPQRPPSAFTRAAADDSAAATDSTRLA